jgi:hypothetical protein
VTDLNVGLSQELQTELGTAGVWAYAVYFDSSGDPQWTTLVANGSITNDGTNDIALPGTFVSGKVYFLVQSLGSGDSSTLTSSITTQSDINWNTASSLDFRYDSFEVTLSGSSADQGNLTSVESFGFPMEVSIPYANGTTATVGYGVPGSQISSDIGNINTHNGADDPSNLTTTFTAGPLSGDFRMAMGPSTAVGPGISNAPFSASDWNSFIQALEGPAASDIILSGEFNGAEDANGVYHNGGYYAYQLAWDSTDQAFWLEPLPQSQIKGYIEITPTQLADSIYSTLGTADIYTNMSDTTPYLSGMNTGTNNQWGTVLRSLVVGFSAGYYLQGGVPINPQLSGTIDLNQSQNWDPTYAFQQHVAGPAPGYLAYDPYGAIFTENTNSYGFGYSDALTSQYAAGGPLVSVAQTGSNAGDVPNINLTIFADGQQPSGYVQPVIYNYIAAPSGTYAVPTDVTSGDNIALSFAAKSPENVGVVPMASGTITLNVLTSDVGGQPEWTQVVFDGATAGPAGLWQNWNVGAGSVAGTFIATPAGGGQPAGSMLINDLPVVDNGVTWYQLGVGGKEFNLYTTMSGGQFENPGYIDAGGSLSQAGSLAIDGLASIIPPSSPGSQTVPTFTINFAANDALSYDPSLVEVNTGNVANFGGQPDSPVAGIVTNGSFDALPGQNGVAGNVISTADQNVAFAWIGENNAVGTVVTNWVTAYTNKIGAEDIARVMLVDGGTTLFATGTANIDGQWQTNPIFLPKGSYTVTMQEYLPTDTGFQTPISPASQSLVLTEETSCFVTGTRIRTVAGEVPVEQLSIGTKVPTADGREAKVVWIGRRTLDCRRHRRPASVVPVRVRRGAFAPGQPKRDLLLSPDHALFLDDVLIPVGRLVNGTTIRRMPPGVVTYWHVELDRHDVIFAEGLAVESFLDTGNRSAFENGGPVMQLHPNFRLLAWEGAACAPLVVTGPIVERARAMLTGAATHSSAAERERSAHDAG